MPGDFMHRNQQFRSDALRQWAILNGSHSTGEIYAFTELS